MTRRKPQHFAPHEHAAAADFLDAYQRKDRKGCSAAARAFLPQPAKLPTDPVKRMAAHRRMLLEALAAAQRDNSHIAVTKLLKDLRGIDAEAGERPSGAPTPDEAVDGMVAMPQLWREAGERDALRDEALKLAVWWCERDEDFRAAVRAAGGER